MRAFVTAAVLVHCAGLCALIVGLDYYTLVVNRTNHTGIPISWMLALYVASFLGGVAFVRWRPTGMVDVRAAWCVLIVSALAIANIAVLDAFNVMMEYERWVSKGLPERTR